MFTLLTLLVFSASTHSLSFDVLPKNNTTWGDTGVRFEYKLCIKTMPVQLGNYEDIDESNVSTIELWSFGIDRGLADQLPYLCSLVGLFDDQHVVVRRTFLEFFFFEKDEHLIDKCPCYYENLYSAKVIFSQPIICRRGGWIDIMTGELSNVQRHQLCYWHTPNYITGIGHP